MPAILRKIPRDVWVLGFVSLLMDVSSEMIHSLLPVFLVAVLHATAVSVGLLEGAAEATALIVKIFSGVISDYFGKRKPLAVAGYGLGALSKPLFALAPTVGAVLGARLLDRVGKGVRGAPRDALVAEVTPPELRGAAFGLRQGLDTVGAFLGPLLAILLMLLMSNNYRAVFWFAVLPGAMAVLLLLMGVHEPVQEKREVRANPIQLHNLKQFDSAYWSVVGIGAVLMLARFSEAFLVLDARNAGIRPAYIPLVLVVMNIVYSAIAYPAGKLSDRVRHSSLLIYGILVLLAADAVLLFASNWPSVMLGIALWGAHMGLSQGLLARMIADTAPRALLGTAYGFFNLVSGIALLIASSLAGLLWDSFGAKYTFATGGGFCVLALFALSISGAKLRRQNPQI